MKKIINLLLALLISSFAFAQQNGVVTVKNFKKGINRKNAVVLDVRTPEEYAEGHLKDAININWQNPDEFKAKTALLHTSKPVYVYCRSGVRSEKASEWLLKNGFTQVIGLNGGMKAWLDEGKTVVKNKQPGK